MHVITLAFRLGRCIFFGMLNQILHSMYIIVFSLFLYGYIWRVRHCIELRQKKIYFKIIENELLMNNLKMVTNLYKMFLSSSTVLFKDLRYTVLLHVLVVYSGHSHISARCIYRFCVSQTDIIFVWYCQWYDGFELFMLVTRYSAYSVHIKQQSNNMLFKLCIKKCVNNVIILLIWYNYWAYEIKELGSCYSFT